MPGVDGGSPGRDRKGPPDATQDGATPSIPAPSANPQPEAKPAAAAMVIEYDDFGLPIKKYMPLAESGTPDAEASPGKGGKHRHQESKGSTGNKGNKAGLTERRGTVEKPAGTTQASRATANTSSLDGPADGAQSASDRCSPDAAAQPGSETPVSQISAAVSSEKKTGGESADIESEKAKAQPKPSAEASTEVSSNIEDQAASEARKPQQPTAGHKRDASTASGHGVAGVAGVSAYSHQQLTSQQPEKEEEKPDEWQTMPAYAAYDMYDDDNKLIAKEYTEADDETYGYGGLGGAGKGYTKVLVDDDAESATSMDENTQYLFKEAGGSTSIADDDGDQRDAVSQLQATKDLLTEGQRVAYVGLTRLELSVMLKEVESLEPTSSRTTKKQLTLAAENMKMWSQKMMIRLYAHMDISPAEQVMIEQLSAHGVIPQDLTPVLMANARVKNPMAADEDGKSSIASPTPSRPASVASPVAEQAAEPPPPYSVDDGAGGTTPVLTPVEMPTTQKIDIDIRWTVLCDLFLVLIADSIYDARSRSLLEKVASDLEISWLEICRFEKKVTDALEMQQNAETENWNEEGHMETRRKLALKRRYMMMGLATVGGGLVIGLSAGLLAPAIGMGLAAGLATIVGSGSTAAGGFLAGAGGAAIITSTAAASGSLIGGRAANRRTGSVKTFEYRPLNNNKRVNLIVTVSGWMTGKVDDVRLPFSTVDPVMGDIYSVLWEPEMLTSMGDTINILATEVSPRFGEYLAELNHVLMPPFIGAHAGSAASPGQYDPCRPDGSHHGARRAHQTLVPHRQPLDRFPGPRHDGRLDPGRLAHRAQPRDSAHHARGLLPGQPCHLLLPPGTRQEGRLWPGAKRLSLWEPHGGQEGRVPARAHCGVGPLPQRLQPQRLDPGLPVPSDQRRHQAHRRPGAHREHPGGGEHGRVRVRRRAHGLPDGDATAAARVRLAGGERRVHRDRGPGPREPRGAAAGADQ